MFILTKKFYAQNFGMVLVLIICLYSTQSYSDVCFLPMGGCVAGDALSTPENCAGYSAQKKNGQGWNCATCNANGHTYYKCEEKPCGAGYTAGIESCSRGFTHEYEKDAGGKYVYSGDKKCGKCTTPNGCADGTQLSPVCEQSGFIPVETQNYKGAQVCYACLDDNCYNGKKKECDWNTAWYNSREWYTSTARTQYGSTCYQCCNNKCSIGSLQVTCNSSTEQKRWRGRTNCGYSCYDCCNDVCSSGSKTPCASDEHPSYTTTTECGSTCYVNCVPNCSDECPVSTASKYVSCSTGFTKTISESTECGSSCYTCEVAGCARGFSTSVTSCSEGDKVCSGKSGDDDCCRCRKTCPSGAETTDKSSNGYSCDECEFENGSTGYVCTCTKEFEQPKDTSGIVYCYNCSDEDDKANPCYGKYHCQGGGRVPEGEVTCSCPYRADGKTEDSDTKYYERCMVNEDCFEEHLWSYEAYTWCYASARPSAYGNGYYNAGKKCTRKTDNKDVNWYVPCTARADCWGNPSPAAGKKSCSDNQGIVKNEDGTTTTQGIECGNKLYFDECTGCNDEYYQEGEKYCSAIKKSSQEYYSNHGYYFVKSKCGTGNDEIVYIQRCDSLFKYDCDGKPTIAYGLKECEEGYGVGTPVECGGYKYYKDCSGCKVPSSKTDGKGNTCWASLASNCNRNTEEKCIYQGYYWIEDDTCQEDGEVKYVYYAKCDDIHCAGKGPAYGMHICPAGSQPDQSKKIVKCGGYTYAESCLAECSYNYTEDARITDETRHCAEGQTFVPKCSDNNDPPITWGECK